MLIIESDSVSAAQTRQGEVFDVAVVNGSNEYKSLMAQIRQDLTGNRSEYYSQSYHDPRHHYIDWPSLESYSSYFRRMYRYLIHGPPEPENITNAEPIFRDILASIQNATEEKLGAKMNTTGGFYAGGKIYMYLTSPFSLNETLAFDLRAAMHSLNMSIHYHHYSIPTQPWVEWHDHSNDERDYSGARGTEMAFENARTGVEMEEYDPWYRYGDFVCGTPMVEEDMRIEREQKVNGTWVEPPRVRQREWECSTWRECWRSCPNRGGSEWWVFWGEECFTLLKFW